MSNRTKLIMSSLVLALAPSLALADLTTLGQQIGLATGIVTGTLPKLAFGLALFYFLWGLLKYVSGVDDKTKDAAKTTILYGVIVLFVMSSIWGLVKFLQEATGVSSETGQKTPMIQE